MDALTHGLIGLTIAGLSGQAPAFDNPVYLAAVLGSQAPDFDILALSRGGMSYLKQHRAASHSLPGIVGWATVIAAALHLFMPEVSLWLLWSWAFAGGMSHILTDYLNTHGAALLWPLRKERLSCNLLNVFDPFLIILLLSTYVTGLPIKQVSVLGIVSIGLYIALRLLLRQQALRYLREYFADFMLGRTLIMPSLAKTTYWDFVLETEGHFVVGRIGTVQHDLLISAVFPKQCESEVMIQAQQTSLAEFFTLFTPFSYFEEQQHDGTTKIKIYDLRYFQNDEFLHSGILVYENNQIPVESYVQSYGRKLNFPF